jgi:hypothetical protein
VVEDGSGRTFRDERMDLGVDGSGHSAKDMVLCACRPLRRSFSRRKRSREWFCVVSLALSRWLSSSRDLLSASSALSFVLSFLFSTRSLAVCWAEVCVVGDGFMSVCECRVWDVSAGESSKRIMAELTIPVGIWKVSGDCDVLMLTLIVF